jgi:hypothetical protein
MTYRRLGVALISAALLAGGAATTSLAQQPPGPRADAPRGEMRPRLSPEERAARRAEYLRAALQLRPDQEAALRTYLDAGRRAPGERMQMRAERREMAQMTTPERLDRRAERMRERQARFEAHAAATKRFYAALSPAQQKAFDALRAGGGRGHGGGRHGFGGPSRG